MATEKKPEKKKTISHSGGEMHFGFEVLLFVVAIFILWVLTGGTKKPVEDKPFITPLTNPINPGMKYSPTDNPYGSTVNN